MGIKMKKTAMPILLLAGMAVLQASAVFVSVDSAYVGSIMLENFSGGIDPSTAKQQLVLGSMAGGLAIYDYPAGAGSEGYASFAPTATSYDPNVYRNIRLRMYVDQNAGEKMIQLYPSPIGTAGVVSKGMAPGLFFALSANNSASGGSYPELKEQQFDLTALSDDGTGLRLDPMNYANDGEVDHWAVDYFMADRGSTKGVEFDHDGDSMGLGLVEMGASVGNGVLSGTATGSDARIYLHDAPDLRHADADAYRYVEVRMKGSGDRIELFWSTSATAEIRSVLLCPAGGDGDYHTYLVDFTDETNWTGMVDYLRLDPNTTPGKTFEVDYVRLVVPDAAMLELQALKKQTEQLPQEADSFRIDSFDPLFATWLDGQYTIQTRLIQNIVRDQSRGTGAVFRVESELDDLRYMQTRVEEEIAYLRNLPADDGSAINVLDYGAVGDGIADDGIAIADAIAAANGSATHTVFFPAGKYFIGEAGAATTGSYHLRLEMLSDLLLKGEDDTELIFGNPVRGGIDIVDCNNVRLENFSITYRPLPYTLGTVTEVVSNGYVLTVKDGFPAPTEPYFQASDFGGLSRFYSVALLPGSVRPEFSNAAAHLDNPVVTQLSPADFLFEYGACVSDTLLGMNVCFQSRMFGNMAVAIHFSERCRLENVRVYASPAMAFLSNGSDMTFINNCSVGPDPEHPATFASSNADGIFIRDALM